MGNNLVKEFSIIVPVYNTEKYLSECIESILVQTYTNFELLLIDDGSFDNSGLICDEYAKKDSRIRVFHKNNGGVSSARNMGIANSNGSWITFVDSDDYLQKDGLANLYSKVSSGVDMVVYASEIGRTSFTDADYLSQGQAIKSLLSFRGFPSSLYLSLYSKQLLQDQKLDESIHYWEDFDFQFTYLLKVKLVAVNHISAYFYRQREGSATHSGFNEKVFSCLKIPEKIQFQSRFNLIVSKQDVINISVFFLSQCFVSMLLDTQSDSELKQRLEKVLKAHRSDIISSYGIIGFKLKIVLLLNTYTNLLNMLFRILYK